MVDDERAEYSAADDTAAALVDALRDSGWCCLPRFLDAELVAALRAELRVLLPQFRSAAVGRAQLRQQRAAIRSDATLWLDASTAAQRMFLETMESLRLSINRQLYLGLFDFEAHYAHYAPGAFYQRHRDVFRAPFDGDSMQAVAGPRRVLSSVFYLNEDWREADGGELVLWDVEDRELARITPEAGTAVFFLSAEMPHEVLPARIDRYSIAGWFRAQGER